MCIKTKKQQQSCINNNTDINIRNFKEGLFQSCFDAGSDQNRECCLQWNLQERIGIPMKGMSCLGRRSITGTWAMRLKLLFLVISICNFASFFVHPSSFICIVLSQNFWYFKRPQQTTSFPAMCIYIYIKRDRVSTGLIGLPEFRIDRVFPS